MAIDPSLDPNAGGGDPFFQTYGGGTGSWQGQPDAQGQTGTPPVVAGASTAPAPGGPPAPQLGGGMSRDQVSAYVTDLYRQKGVTPNSTDISYWTDRYFDPAYKGDWQYWDGKLKNQNESFGGGGGGYGGQQIPLGQFGSLAQGWNGQFHAPSAQDAANTPGYQFTLHQGIDALDGSAAARGTVLGGGHAKAVMDYATGLADQTYGSTYNRALGEYGQAYNEFRQGGNDLFDRYYKLGGLGTDAATKATS